MKTLCVCGCRREARTQWRHPSLGTFRFAALCSIRLGKGLEGQGWHEEPDLDDTADLAPREAVTT